MLNENIKAIRKSKGLSQQELAIKLNVVRQTISKWEDVYKRQDLYCMQEDGIVSQYRRYESWYKDFCEKLPSYQEGILDFTFVANREGKIRYSDGYQKNNSYIPQILPNVYYIDAQRSLDHFQENILMLQEDELLKQVRTGCCMFDRAKKM